MTEAKWRKEIGLRIRRARRARDIIQADLAQRLGAESAGFICDVEKGRKSLCAYKLFLLEKELGPLWQQGCGPKEESGE